MRAMMWEEAGRPLVLRTRAMPVPEGHDVLVEVEACGVCRTDLHLVDGELPGVRLPIVPGHEVVGVVVARGPEAQAILAGARVGIGWLGGACGACRFCLTHRENLCGEARFTGLSRDGGYATHVLADARFCIPLPSNVAATTMAPWLCAGAIGHRAWTMAGEARRIGLIGFGASAHLVAKVAAHAGQEVHAFTRPGDEAAQALARACGAVWVGSSDETPPEPLDAAIVFAPDGALVPRALKLLERGGTVVCAGIHMSDVPSFPYRDLWGERSIRSVANVTREDMQRFVAMARSLAIEPQVTTFPLSAANEALSQLREGALTGAAVLLPSKDTARPRRRTSGRMVSEWRAYP